MKCPPSLSLSLSLSLCCSLALSLSLSLPLSIYLCMPMCARLHAHHAHARKRPRALFTRAKYPQAMPLQKHECTTRCSAPPAPSCMPHSPAHIGTHGRTDASTHGRMHARARARAHTHTHTHTRQNMRPRARCPGNRTQHFNPMPYECAQGTGTGRRYGCVRTMQPSQNRRSRRASSRSARAHPQ